MALILDARPCGKSARAGLRVCEVRANRRRSRELSEFDRREVRGAA